MNDLKKYLESTLGVNVEIIPIAKDRMKGLPYFVESNYNLFSTTLFNREIVLVELKENTSAGTLSKHLNIIRQAFQLLAVAVMQPIEAYNRLRLIEKKVPFVITGKQMFMPQLLIDLKEFGVHITEKQETMQPAAQLLVLFHLQVESLEGFNLKTIAEKLDYNSATITRAVKYLLSINLCELHGTKDKFLHFNFSKHDLWAKSESLMFNPIKKSTYYAGVLNESGLKKTNINALSVYSDLNPTIMVYYAAKPMYIKHLINENPTQIGQMEGDICIEEWKYDPQKLSNSGTVDKLSLYLCLRENKDERVQDALEQLIKTMPW
jgi:hypothetical protein